MADMLDWLVGGAQDDAGLMSGVFAFLAVATLTVAVATFVRVRGDVRRRAAERGGGEAAAPNARSARQGAQVATQRLLETVSRHFVPADPKEVARLRQQLMQAGFLNPSAVAWFFLARVAGGLGLGVLAALGLPQLFDELSFANHWTLIATAAIVGYIGPSFYLSKRTARLAREHRAGFPDFMDLMVVCADAGLSMEAAIDRVSREIVESYPSLSANLYMAVLELRAGRTLGDALDHLGNRLGIPEARSFATLLQQSEELGSSLTEALRIYSDDMRHKRLSRAEEKAYALPAKLVIPLGIFIFPVLFIVILLPAYVRVRSHF